MDSLASEKSIIALDNWLQTPPGAYVRAWEQVCIDSLVADIFGFNAVQIGTPQIDALAANRMPNRWLADTRLRPPQEEGGRRIAVTFDYSELPFASQSLDLVVMPHVLEFAAEPHQVLREVERVLMPEGKVVICCLNPASLWGLRQRRAHVYRRLGFGELYLPDAGDFIGYWRLRDWLRLLSFEVETSSFGCYRPSFSSEKWLDRFSWMDAVGGRSWPIFGAVYFIVAVKRVRGIKLVGARWRKPARIATAPVPIATNRSAREAREPTLIE